MENILFAILSLIVGIVIGCGLFYAVLVNKTSKSMKNANKLIEDAKKEAELPACGNKKIFPLLPSIGCSYLNQFSAIYLITCLSLTLSQYFL